MCHLNLAFTLESDVQDRDRLPNYSIIPHFLGAWPNNTGTKICINAVKVYMESKRHLDLRDLAWPHAACWARMANANWILHGRMQMFSRPFRELIPRNKDGDYCSLNPKAAGLMLEEKLKMVMRLRNGEGGSMFFRITL